jgi:DNA-binding MarR family transcriptional regulator
MKQKYPISNLSEWAIILYLEKNKSATRKKIAEDFNVPGSRVGYIIKKLKDKNIIDTKFGKHKKEVLYFLVI